MLIASAKSRSVRGASHQPASMSGCLTISHTCLPCLSSERTLLSLGGKWAGKGGRVMSWEGRKGVWVEWGGKVGKVEEYWGGAVGEVEGS